RRTGGPVNRKPSLAERFPNRPRPSRSGRLKALGLALFIHLALVAMLVIGVSWKSSEPPPVIAELWTPAPAMAQPRPAPKPEPKPEPRPEPKPEPRAEPEPPPEPAPDPQIAIERARREAQEKHRLEEERRRKLAEEQKRKAEEER